MSHPVMQTVACLHNNSLSLPSPLSGTGFCSSDAKKPQTIRTRLEQRPNKVTPASSPEVSSGTQFLAKDLEGGVSAGTIWEVVSFALRRGSHTEGTWLCEEVTPRALGKLMWKRGGAEGGEEPGGLSQTLHQPGVTSLQKERATVPSLNHLEYSEACSLIDMPGFK